MRLMVRLMLQACVVTKGKVYTWLLFQNMPVSFYSHKLKVAFRRAPSGKLRYFVCMDSDFEVSKFPK